MNKFYIDIAYATDITIRKVFYITRRDDETEEDFLIRKLKKPGPIGSSTSSDDHPEFAKLRNELEKLGFIRTDRNSWNGDRVLREFFLNDKKFAVGEKFPCGSAIHYDLTH